jgi:hypothetical protein
MGVVDSNNKVDADVDADARGAIWRAIHAAAEQLAHKCSVLMTANAGGTIQNVIGQPIPPVPTWQLAEGLSLLTVLLRADDVSSRAVKLFVKTGPIEIVEDNLKRYLWVQHSVRGKYSALLGRPDLVVTSSSGLPSADNVVRIVEIKCCRRFGIGMVRAEFGKAHDLRVRSYFIWTYYSQSPRVVAGAKGLGLDVEGLGFDTSLRTTLVSDPAALVSKVAHALEQSRKSERFARQSDEANQDIRRKLLGPAK